MCVPAEIRYLRLLWSSRRARRQGGARRSGNYNGRFARCGRVQRLRERLQVRRASRGGSGTSQQHETAMAGRMVMMHMAPGGSQAETVRNAGAERTLCCHCRVSPKAQPRVHDATLSGALRELCQKGSWPRHLYSLRPPLAIAARYNRSCVVFPCTVPFSPTRARLAYHGQLRTPDPRYTPQSSSLPVLDPPAHLGRHLDGHALGNDDHLARPGPALLRFHVEGPEHRIHLRRRRGHSAAAVHHRLRHHRLLLLPDPVRDEEKS